MIFAIPAVRGGEVTDIAPPAKRIRDFGDGAQFRHGPESEIIGDSVANLPDRPTDRTDPHRMGFFYRR